MADQTGRKRLQLLEHTHTRHTACRHGTRSSLSRNLDKIARHLKDCPALVAHNAAFDMSCIRHSLQLYGIPVPEINYYCSLRAARRLYDFECNRLDYLCQQFDIPYGHHHRAGDDAEMCARLFLREIKDAGWCSLEEMTFCGGKL